VHSHARLAVAWQYDTNQSLQSLRAATPATCTASAPILASAGAGQHGAPLTLAFSTVVASSAKHGSSSTFRAAC